MNINGKIISTKAELLEAIKKGLIKARLVMKNM